MGRPYRPPNGSVVKTVDLYQLCCSSCISFSVILKSEFFWGPVGVITTSTGDRLRVRASLVMEGLDLDALLKMDLLVAEHRDGSVVTEEAPVSIRTLIATGGHNVLVSKKRYMPLLRCFAAEVQTGCCESDAASREQ